MKQGIIFNSEDEVVLTVDQVKEIGKVSPKQLVQYFHATAIYRDVMRDLIDDHGKSVLTVNDEELTDLRIELVNSGYHMLVNQLMETFGEDTACLIIVDAHNSINLEKNGQF
jgi:hypothetical protein